MSIFFILSIFLDSVCICVCVHVCVCMYVCVIICIVAVGSGIYQISFVLIEVFTCLGVLSYGPYLCYSNSSNSSNS